MPWEVLYVRNQEFEQKVKRRRQGAGLWMPGWQLIPRGRTVGWDPELFMVGQAVEAQEISEYLYGDWSRFQRVLEDEAEGR